MKKGLIIVVFMLLLLMGCDFNINNKKVKVFLDDDFGNITEVSVNIGEVLEAFSPTHEGYKFICWTLDGTDFSLSTTISESITLVAKWEKIEDSDDESKVDIVFVDNDGNELFKETISKGENATLVNAPEIKGFKFKGWDNSLENINENTTFKPIYELIEYEIQYILDGGSNNKNPISYNIQSEITLSSPDKEGYIFLGWFINDEKYESIAIGTIGDLVFEAKWEKVKVETVANFDLNGGEFSLDEQKLFSESKVIINTIILTKYNVDYWENWDGNIILLPADTKFDARYSGRIGFALENNSNSNNSSNSNGNGNSNGNSYSYGYVVKKVYSSGVLTADTDFSDCDYIIVCAENYSSGYKSLNINEIKIGDYLLFDNINFTELTEDINVNVSVYELGELEYRTIYNEISDLPIPVKENYTFLGWDDGTGELYTKVPVNTSEVNFKAMWKFEGDNIMVLIEEIASETSGRLGLTSEIYSDLDLKTIDEKTGAILTWNSLNTDVLSNDGKLTRIIGKETTVRLDLKITFEGVTADYSYDVNVRMGYKDIYNGGVIAGYNYTSNIPDSVTLEAVDILYCAFGQAGTNGKITNFTSIGNYVKQYVDKAHSYGDYVILCVNTSELATVCASASLRKVFVDDVLKAINDFNLDGIDIDWERPKVSEKTNYTALMRELYAAVKGNNPEHLVTTATAGGPWQYPSFDLENSIKYIDFINLMTYDLHTSASSTHHSGLYKSSNGYTLTQCTIDQSIPLYNACGVPNNKILIGIPFYGRKFSNTDGIGKSAKSDGSATFTYISETYLQKVNASVTLGWDDECKVPYIYDSANRLFISYDDPKSIGIKAEYIKEKGLAGMMYWQNSQDYNHTLLLSMKSNKEVMKNK